LRLLRRLRVALFALGATGCIALVQPFDVGDHCTIVGETACAACVRTKCQTQVDTCCGATYCGLGVDGFLSAGKSDVLEAVDRCGAGDKAACASKLASKRSGKEEESVRACVTTSCNAECLGDAAGVVDDTGLAWTCDLPRDSEKSCGSCIYDECAGALDDCCSDDTCSRDTSLQGLVGGCAVAEDPALCVYRYLNRSTSGVAGPVAKCMQASCAAACFGDGRSHTRCSLYSDGAYCACTDAERSSGQPCVKASDTHCALGKSGCTCGRYACSAGARDGCSCSLHGTGEETSCAPSQDSSTCCVVIGDGGPRCTCDPNATSCSTSLGEYEISSCDEDVFLAKIADLLVDSCSH
jgi:hypothetical protein